MKWSLPAGITVLAVAVAGAADMQPIDVPIAPGPCEPTWKSLGDHFQTPTWWREAKIGMWLHWGPQSVGEDGDWYAKWLYMPRDCWGDYGRVYPDHLKRFGHPSVSGYKDILPLWKAEKWDPDKLMALYHRAGARYVIGQGMHHDNFDLWNSKYQPWNAVKIGPHRDILGGWCAAARKQGMRFGIAFHGDYSLWWYQPAFLHDLDGPLKGVPYDAARNYDGKATWWKKLGLNLRDLYGVDLKEDVAYPADAKTEDERTAFRFRDPLSHGIPDGDLKVDRDFAVWFATKWTRRVIDAIDQFDPDFIYFDGGGSYPFCGHGTGRGLRANATPRVIADLYNKSMAEHGGRLEAMAFTKGNEDPRAVAVNVESSVPADIKRDPPWQTENGLGEWFYKAGTFYDSGMVIHQMLEAISRDGNYAINIPLRPAGDLDPGGLQVLNDMGDWMDVNSGGIHGSSAWNVWGEGQVVMKGGNLGPEQARTPYTGRDIRFTTKNGAVFAWLMAWPDGGKTVIRSLADGVGKVTNVTLLGHTGKLAWRQTGDGLEVVMPDQKPCQFAFGLKITGADLKAVSYPAGLTRPAAAGSTTLPANGAKTSGGDQAGDRVGQPAAKPPIRVLIVDGFSNHDWRLTTRLIRGVLAPTKLFAVTVSTAPETAGDPGWPTWRPRFADYDVVIQTCNDIGGGPRWPDAVQNDLVNYVGQGGGLYVFHSANNAFSGWKEYERMVGLLWRRKDQGYALAVTDDGQNQRIPPGEGLDTGHGNRFDALVHRRGEHAIHAGLPPTWRAADIEVYYYARGPLEKVDVLSYAAEPHTHMQWPIEWTVNYGQGRVYASTYGHVWHGDSQPVSLRCAAAQTLMVRALQWLARRPVDYSVPSDFPTADKASVRGPVVLP